MKKIITLIFVVLCVKLLSANLLYDITDGKFRAKVPVSVHSMNDGENFTQMIDNKLIVKYNYKTGLPVDTLFNVSKIGNSPVKNILGYIFSDDETKILVFANRNYRYRRTFSANFYVYNTDNKKITSLSENGEQEVPQFSPDSKKVIFVRKNNIFIKDLEYNTEIQMTHDGKFNSIINGTSDWVYEEEFTTTRYFEFSPDNKYVVYLKFDETNVPLFSMIRYTDDNLTENQLLLYPRVETFKYPKAGQSNSKVSVWLYNINTKENENVKINTSETEFYIPRIKWTNKNDEFAIFVLNRHQNKLEMFFANTSTKNTQLIFTDTDKYYVDYENIDKFQFLKNNASYIFTSERDGFRHAYISDISGKNIKLLTKGNWDITNMYGFDENTQQLYYQSAENSPLQRDIYSVDTKGIKTKLSEENGTHEASFSANFKYFIDNFSSLKIPNIITLRNNKGKLVREIQHNKELQNKFDSMNFAQKEFFQFKTSEGISLNGWILKPQNTSENIKYPLLMVQYSGPDSQQALDSWKIDWEYFLSTQGYAVACVDGRGTGARGSEFRKCTYKKLGVLETKDQIEAAKYLGALSFVDKNRIGIWGWSYGGFTVLNSMSTDENIFKAGIAVAPVTDWRLYNTAYTERFMQTPQENPEGYAAGSPISKVKNLHGNLIIIHGTADDNVHLQNTMIYVEKLIDTDKQIETYTYTDKNHSILGKQTRRHLYDKKIQFLEENLK